MKLRLGTILAVGLLAATLCRATDPMPGGESQTMGPAGGPMGGQQGGPGGGMGGGPGASMAGQRDSFMQTLFPPELIMRNQQELGLSEEQKTAIKDAMKEQMGQFSSVQWDQTEAQDALNELLKGDVIDQNKALDQLDKLLTVEAKLKKIQFAGMVTIRNILTPAQVAILKDKKQAMSHHSFGGMAGHPPMPPTATSSAAAATTTTTQPPVATPASSNDAPAATESAAKP